MQFKKATKEQAKLRFTFDGPAGSGKTYSSLVLAKAMGGRVALIDTEHGSASKYADRFEFDSLPIEDHSLKTYLAGIALAASERYDVLIIDSLSHAWAGKGGALEQVDRTGGKSKFTGGWREVTPLHNRLVDAMLGFSGHLIATMRTKMAYVLEKDKDGREVPRKVGMAPIQREGMEYEFDVMADLGIDETVTIGKTRFSDIRGALLRYEDLPAMGAKLKKWLSDGVPVAAPVPPAPATAAPETKPDGKAPSLREQAEIALGEAQSRRDVEATLPRIRALPKAEQDALRPLYMRRLAEVA